MKHAASWPVAGVLVLAVTALVAAPAPKAKPYRSPFDVAFSPDSKTVAAGDATAGAVVFVDAAKGQATGEVALEGEPAGLVWAPDGTRLYVAERGAGAVAEVDPAARKVVRRLEVGPRPEGVALAPKRKLLLAANTGTDTLSVVDLASGKEKARLAVSHSPRGVAVTPDETLALVTHLFAAEPASVPTTSAAVVLVDLETLKVAGEVRLPPNGALARGVAVSPDGKWGYVVHCLGRTTLPTTQLERGWVNTNGMTIIDLTKREAYATVLLDQLSEGAADPWGAACSPDGKTLWITLSGTHQLGRVKLDELHRLLAGKTPEDIPEEELRARGFARVWLEIRDDPKAREKLSYDLAAMYGAGLFKRTQTRENGLRGVAVSPDGKRVAAAGYYSGNVLLASAEGGRIEKSVAVGEAPAPDLARQGEMIFHDATYCFQHWLSCATCHPEGRADGLNWDLLNDGIGNPKNTKSLFLSHKTPPVMSLGVRATMEVASEAGFRFILFREPEGSDLEAVRAYLVAMPAADSPYLEGGKLSAKGRQGEKVFEKAGCAACHPAPLYTDLKMYDVGTRGELDRKDAFDTPTLIELWRTGPYLHDGSAMTLEEVFTKHNPNDRHGTTSKLSPEELEALVEFLKSL